MRTLTAQMKTLSFAVFLASALSSTFAHAEKKTLKVKGMHCKGCVEMVEGEVCEVQKFKSCKVKLASGEKNVGQIELETEGKTPIDLKSVKEKISSAGNYTVIE